MAPLGEHSVAPLAEHPVDSLGRSPTVYCAATFLRKFDPINTYVFRFSGLSYESVAFHRCEDIGNCIRSHAGHLSQAADRDLCALAGKNDHYDEMTI